MEHVETERKYTVATEGSRNSVGEDLGINLTAPYGWGDSHRMTLVADYVDTVDLALFNAGYTLRRRDGGEDEGWHLKAPKRGESRAERHVPLTAGSSAALVPWALRELVDDVVELDALVPVARLVTDRSEHAILRIEDGVLIAVLDDDRVTSSALAGPDRVWREVEVELVDGTIADLDAIEPHLLAAGLAPSADRTKLAHALGSRADDPGHATDHSAAPSAGTVLVGYLARQVGTLQGLESKTRSDSPDAVHKSRVATRRLRSTLRTFRDVLDRSVTDPIALEVRWLGEVLGAPRDAEVLKERIVSDLADLPADRVVGDIGDRVERTLEDAHREAHAALVRALDSQRAANLMEALVGLLVEPPLTPRAGRSAAKELKVISKQVRRRVERARAAAMAMDDEDQRLLLLHEVRKKSKAARYAHEAFGHHDQAQAKDLAKRWEEVTESLGELQDTIVTTERLRELAAEAALAGQPSATYELLVDREQRRGRKALSTALRVLDALTRRG